MTNPEALNRRDALRKAAVGAGATAAVVAAPAITGLGAVPAFAQGATCNADTTPTTTTVDPAFTLSITNTTATGAVGLVCPDVVAGLEGATIPLGFAATATNPTEVVIAGSGTIAMAVTVDYCSLYAAQVNGVLAGAPANTTFVSIPMQITNTVLTFPTPANTTLASPTVSLPDSAAFDLTAPVTSGVDTFVLAPCPTVQNINVVVNVDNNPALAGQTITLGAPTLTADLAFGVSVGAPFLCNTTNAVTAPAATVAGSPSFVAVCP